MSLLVDTRMLTKDEFEEYIQRMITLGILSQNGENNVRVSKRFTDTCKCLVESKIFWDKLVSEDISDNPDDYAITGLIGSCITTICGKIPDDDNIHMINIVRLTLKLPMIIVTCNCNSQSSPFV